MTQLTRRPATQDEIDQVASELRNRGYHINDNEHQIFLRTTGERTETQAKRAARACGLGADVSGFANGTLVTVFWQGVQ